MKLSKEQQRAKDAHARVSARAAQKSDWPHYRTMALKLPVMVHNEGVVQSLHFVAARGRPEQRAILDDLAQDLGKSNRSDLLGWLRGLGEIELREHTREIQRRLAWYKRIVQAFGKGGIAPGGDS